MNPANKTLVDQAPEGVFLPDEEWEEFKRLD
jgi:hypothetical protein